MAEEAGQDADDSVELGGNIRLSWLKHLDRSEVIVVKKIVGNYARRFSEICGKLEELSVHMKLVHEKEKGEVYVHTYRPKHRRRKNPPLHGKQIAMENI